MIGVYIDGGCAILTIFPVPLHREDRLGNINCEKLFWEDDDE